jgi:ribosome biogenesis GTPase
MARHKGKSRRRLKGWDQRVGDDFIEDQNIRRQRFGSRQVKLPPKSQEESLDDLPRTQALVVGLFPGGVAVRVNDDVLLCGIAGTFRPPEGSSALAVGDMVTVGLTPEPDAASATDKDRADGIIIERQPRRTALARPEPRSGKRGDRYQSETFEKVIAANMDVLLIVAASRQPPLRHGLIDRFLIIAERGGLESLLVINKIDIARPDQQIVDEFRELGLEVLLVSAQTGEGLDELRQRLAGRMTVLAGASGVGKTTITNALIPGTDAPTQAIRMRDQRGRHTTTSSDIYELPRGGILIDTPGVRELGIHLDLRELQWYFPEFDELSRSCRFNDCTHTHEPGCAIQQAVEEGILPPRRYQSYLRIRETIEERFA